MRRADFEVASINSTIRSATSLARAMEERNDFGANTVTEMCWRKNCTSPFVLSIATSPAMLQLTYE